ncbi:hypothetical protein JCM8097_008618 [Rhodosporidiobolus ruineniae]
MPSKGLSSGSVPTQSRRTRTASAASAASKGESSTPATSLEPSPGVEKRVKDEDEEEDEVGSRSSRKKRATSRLLQAVKKEESDDEKEKKPSARVARSAAPSVVPRDGDDGFKVKIKEEVTEEDLTKTYEENNAVARPYWLTNLLDPADWSSIPELNVKFSPEIEALHEEPMKRVDLAGPNAGTIWGGAMATGKASNRYTEFGYTNERWALIAALQVGISRPGAPFLATGKTVDWMKHNDKDEPVTIVVRYEPEGECWQGFGNYVYAYNGRALDGEFNRLTEDKKENLVHAVHGYLLGETLPAYNRFLFRECTLPARPDHPEDLDNPRFLLDHRHSLSWQEQHDYIRELLATNNPQLRMGYSLMRCVGPMTKELEECIARRAPRRVEEEKARLKKEKKKAAEEKKAAAKKARLEKAKARKEQQ